MKKTGILLLILIQSAFAQLDFNETVTTFQSKVYVGQIQCVAQIGSFDPLESRIKTVLNRVNFINDKTVELKHEKAIADGCRLDLLDKMFEDTMNTFGFIDVDVTLTKFLTKKPRILSGKCVHNFMEKVKIDFHNGIALETSKILELRAVDMKECSN